MATTSGQSRWHPPDPALSVAVVGALVDGGAVAVSKASKHSAAAASMLASAAVSPTHGYQRPGASSATSAVVEATPIHSSPYQSPYPGGAIVSSADPSPGPLHASSFSILKAPDSVSDGASGQHKDGRVRNPVPRKLKGKTDNKMGNFSVMHIDLNGTEAKQREGEAKRISENTELAAKKAFENGYVAPPGSKRRFAHLGDHMQPKALTPSGSPPPMADPAPAPVHRLSLTPAETKEEQARLLTLLRSLNPVTVIDQICKALAYFGGIPGAPPPSDGAFPNSAQSNGPGGLFIGWISEIFPKV